MHELGAPIDVIWFRLTRHHDDQENLIFQLARGRGMVAIDRGEFWQCGYLIGKGGFDAWKARGIEAFRRDVAEVAPMFTDRTGELASFEAMGFLEVRVNRLHTWHQPGLLCIGDAAHAMSPVGGVGINLAVQDAIAAANILTRPLWTARSTTPTCPPSSTAASGPPSSPSGCRDSCSGKPSTTSARTASCPPWPAS
ncbi:FAD-dependent monooxygenase [Nonomuraea africana]|uniref:2-polyprenyl-6-methoxyphenol hydroxylase-like FAD-dependent oxidoreductase n=1 Tax=Nonomuraea africana TaxID=46171 RepID=A0ABR9KJJ1_9ACTN|nr:FAD-dependent monooxygenase [Nonomuraea africana]MBE1562193.1 2-polyprenyl-6-methoxyphenol hydroxylase-like FAD-dependent oxidoreductase [Nonomuraea africana]